jgi:uncharacterized protein (DUF58 family)
MVTSIFAGEFRSVFRGRGIEFDEVREYQPGDDVRAIDWNVTARSGRPFVKRYVEERERTLFFIVDASPSTFFGTSGRPKSRLAAEVCALLSYAALRNRDRVGLLLFTDRAEALVPPGKGERHVLRVVRTLLTTTPQGCGTDLAGALERAGRLLRPGTVVFVISDFHAPDFRRPLALLHARHDVVAIPITDRVETEFPDCGVVTLRDAETGARITVDMASPACREEFRRAADRARAGLREVFRSLGVDSVELSGDDDYRRALMAFFRMREERRRRRP